MAEDSEKIRSNRLMLMRGIFTSLNEWAVQGGLALIRLYRLVLSPWIGNQCRFYPTCSHYAEDALNTHGFIKGCWLSLKRIGRCNPFFDGGFDPVPDCNTCHKEHGCHQTPSTPNPH